MLIGTGAFDFDVTIRNYNWTGVNGIVSNPSKIAKNFFINTSVNDNLQYYMFADEFYGFNLSLQFKGKG